MGWPGRVLDGTLPAGRSEATLELEADALRARLPDGSERRLDLSRLCVARLGTAGDLLELREEGTEQPRFSSRDPAFAAALAACGHPGVARALGQERHVRRDALLRKWVKPLAGFALLVAFSLWLVASGLPSLAV
ncbi:MAG: hypothetical protein ACK4N5_09275, partial [Myxococcales bacterium]